MAVHALAYRRLEGARPRSHAPALAIARAELRLLGRRRLLRGAALGAGLFTLLLAGAVVFRSGILDTLLPVALPTKFLPAIDARFFDLHVLRSPFSRLLLLLLAIFGGSGRIAEDLRTNALAVYLSKPLTRTDYLLGKVGATAAVVAIGALAAPLVVWLVAVLADPEFLGANLRTGLGVAVFGAVATAYYTSAILFFSSLVRSGRRAGVLFAALVFLSAAVQETSGAALRGTASTAFLGFRASLDTLSPWLLGTTDARTPPLLPSLAVVLTVVAAGFLTAHRRVRAVEVVA